MKNISAFLLISIAFLCASCSKEAKVVVANKAKPVANKDTSWNVADKNFHYQSYPYEYKGVRFVQYRIHVPQADGTTKLKIETNFNLRYKYRSGNSLEMSIEAATEAVRRLLKKSPQSFPPSTKIVKAYGMGPGEPRITFNTKFADAKWWQNRKQAQAAITSLVQTANETQDSIYPTSGDSSLTVFVEGKPTGKIGDYYVSIPLYDAVTNQIRNLSNEKILIWQQQQYENNKNRPRR